jgi:predicted MFS family arabinose efflux permease
MASLAQLLGPALSGIVLNTFGAAVCFFINAASLAFTSLLVLPYNTVLPVFAKVIFKGNAATFGYITSFVGTGAVIGTIFLASRKPGVNLRTILLISTIILSVGLICFSQIKNFPLAMLFTVLIGFGSVSQFTVCNIVVQSESAPQMRGRIIGILLMAIFGMMPLGSLITGAISQWIGAPNAIFGQGIAALIIAMLFSGFLRKNKPGQPADDVGSIKTNKT